MEDKSVRELLDEMNDDYQNFYEAISKMKLKGE